MPADLERARAAVDHQSMERWRFTIVDAGVSAIAEVDEDRAPRTVERLRQHLPLEDEAVHGIYSGPEIALFIDSGIQAPVENATSNVLPGDIGYYWQPGGTVFGSPDDLAEICWFYDRGARPSSPEGPVAVNLFGRFIAGWEEFAAACAQMRHHGPAVVRVEMVATDE